MYVCVFGYPAHKHGLTRLTLFRLQSVDQVRVRRDEEPRHGAARDFRKKPSGAWRERRFEQCWPETAANGGYGPDEFRYRGGYVGGGGGYRETSGRVGGGVHLGLHPALRRRANVVEVIDAR